MIQEAKLYLYVHPVIQFTGIAFGFFALLWGIKRFLIVHRKLKLVFPWKQHVLYGKIAIFLWLLGLGVGGYFTPAEWTNYRIMGIHHIGGMIVFPLMFGTFLTGYWMERFKKKRVYLCMVHGVVGFLLCTFVFFQIITGVQIFTLFVW